MTQPYDQDPPGSDPAGSDPAGSDPGGSDPGGSDPADERETSPPRETPWQRRKRLAAIFGDVLPETTGDERSSGNDEGKPDDWYRSQVPPHHG
ncbi:hypothetical protein ncot_16545 [Nocardioides sp. JQ2195]|uniref:hypothetical protein n=1 Tax=Nocardioides sp. JQ2195 TaxID=2592334 RepID=UPI00143E4FDB|nr:hypothetical protein [Nocardioides sp. JQ2195]QIX25147.1 hypothetical protein ncot_16545 [Nocardioides sp. JQ2195]